MAKRQEVNQAVTAEALFSEVTVERLRSERDRARDHVIGRNRRVGATLCVLSLMRGAGTIDEKTKVRCQAAALQDFQSSENNEAAHYVPGQIFLEPRGSTKALMHEFIQDAGTRTMVASLFSRVQDLHQNFNKADTYAESYARPKLKKIFERACRRVILGPQPTSNRVGANVRVNYEKWVTESCQSYRYAIDNRTARADLTNRPLVVAGPEFTESGALDPHVIDLEATQESHERAVRRNRHGEVTASATDYSDQIRYLRFYAQFGCDPTLTDRLVRDIEHLFKP